MTPPDFPARPLSDEAGRRLERATDPRYRLHGDEGLAEGVRRVARGRAQRAVERLRAEDRLAEAVHDTRKDLKKLRSLLRLVRAGLGDDAYRAESERYRAAARLLAGARDAEVKIETLTALRTRYPGEAPAAEALQLALERERQRVAARSVELRARMDEAAAAIGAGEAAIDGWPLADADEDGFALLRPGVERAYRRGRRAYRRVRDDDRPSAEAVHEWRKRVKDLWYQARLLRGAWDGPLKATADAAHDLADLLGDHHDLSVLVEDARGRGDADAEALAAVAERRQAELLDRALALGSRLYAEKPRRFADRLQAYWDAWRPAVSTES